MRHTTPEFPEQQTHTIDGDDLAPSIIRSSVCCEASGRASDDPTRHHSTPTTARPSYHVSQSTLDIPCLT